VDPLEQFAANLRAARQTRGLSQERLAELSGLDTTSIGRIERAKRDPGVRIIVRLAKGLGVSPARLLDGIDAE
jgi:transcriptional regulator with XRE-family HTH domain